MKKWKNKVICLMKDGNVETVSEDKLYSNKINHSDIKFALYPIYALNNDMDVYFPVCGYNIPRKIKKFTVNIQNFLTDYDPDYYESQSNKSYDVVEMPKITYQGNSYTRLLNILIQYVGFGYAFTLNALRDYDEQVVFGNLKSLSVMIEYDDVENSSSSVDLYGGVLNNTPDMVYDRILELLMNGFDSLPKKININISFKKNEWNILNINDDEGYKCIRLMYSKLVAIVPTVEYTLIGRGVDTKRSTSCSIIMFEIDQELSPSDIKYLSAEDIFDAYIDLYEFEEYRLDNYYYKYNDILEIFALMGILYKAIVFASYQYYHHSYIDFNDLLCIQNKQIDNDVCTFIDFAISMSDGDFITIRVSDKYKKAYTQLIDFLLYYHEKGEVAPQYKNL